MMKTNRHSFDQMKDRAVQKKQRRITNTDERMLENEEGFSQKFKDKIGKRNKALEKRKFLNSPDSEDSTDSETKEGMSLDLASKHNAEEMDKWNDDDDDDDDDSDSEENNTVSKIVQPTNKIFAKTASPGTVPLSIRQNKTGKMGGSHAISLQTVADTDSSSSSDDSSDGTDSQQASTVTGHHRTNAQAFLQETTENSSDSDCADEDYESGGHTKDPVEDELITLKKELANIPLEDLMKVKEKLGLKVFNKIMHGDTFEEKKQKVFKRANKNRPMEVSSKRKVPILRHHAVPKEKVQRDPRFDDLSGEYQDKHFMKNYAFLSDVKKKEKLLIEKKMKKTTNEDKKKELAKLLKRMTQQEQAEQQKRLKLEMEEKWKEKEKQLVREGKTPYFLKKAEKKKLLLAEKFKELQKSGKVDQYMRKKLKKQSQKERKKIPERHQRF